MFAHLGLERPVVGFRHVGRIRDQHIDLHPFGEGVQEVSLPELHPALEAVALRVLSRQRQRLGGSVGGQDLSEWPLRRQGEGDGATPRPDVRAHPLRRPSLPHSGEDGLHQLLGLGSGNENPLVHLEIQVPEGGRAQNVLHRTSTRPFQEPGTEACQLVGGQGTLVVKVEIEPPHLQRVGQEELHIGSNPGHSLLLQVLGAPPEEVEYGPGPALGGRLHRIVEAGTNLGHTAPSGKDPSSRSSSSASWSTSRTGSSSPSRTWSSWWRVRPTRWSVTRFCGKL